METAPVVLKVRDREIIMKLGVGMGIFAVFISMLPMTSCAWSPKHKQVHFGTDDLKVSVLYPSAKSLQFSVSKNGTKDVKGIAYKSEGDSEVVESPEGDALQATQFIRAGHCWISIAITENGKYLRLEQKGCGSSIPTYSLLERSE